METKFITVFLFSAHLVMMKCDWNILSMTHGIRKFLKTPLPIWTTNTTEDKVGKPQCEADLLMTISKSHITYLHLWYENWMKKKVRITGRFDENKKTRMFIHVKELNYNISEEIVYLNWIQKCAVFMITAPYPGRWISFDVRVWNSSIESRRYTDCIRKFKKLPQKGRGVYNDYCQNIVHEGAKLPILKMKSQEN